MRQEGDGRGDTSSQRGFPPKGPVQHNQGLGFRCQSSEDPLVTLSQQHDLGRFPLCPMSPSLQNKGSGDSHTR